jgi:hypothetical protein
VRGPGTRTAWIGGDLPRGTPVLVGDDRGSYDAIVAAALADDQLSSGHRVLAHGRR